jgi:hypothetical protein
MQAKGDDCFGAGWEALYSCLGNDLIGIGYQAGNGLTSATAQGVICIGRRAGTDGQKADAINGIALGDGSFTTANNQVVLGNSNITTTILRGDISGPDKIASRVLETAAGADQFANTGQGQVSIRRGSPTQTGYVAFWSPTGGLQSYLGFDSGVNTSLTNSSGSFVLSCPLSLGVYTVGTLPSASARAGHFAQVTDSNSTTNGSTVAGGGSNRVPVFSNGTNWIIK